MLLLPDEPEEAVSAYEAALAISPNRRAIGGIADASDG